MLYFLETVLKDYLVLILGLAEAGLGFVEAGAFRV